MCIKIPKETASGIESGCLWEKDYEIGRMEQDIAAFCYECCCVNWFFPQYVCNKLIKIKLTRNNINI